MSVRYTATVWKQGPRGPEGQGILTLAAGITIPATTTAVACTFEQQVVLAVGQTEYAVVGQVLGTLTNNAGTFEFTRLIEGSSTPVASGSRLTITTAQAFQLGANPNGLQLDGSGALNLGDENNVPFPVPVVVQDEIEISGDIPGEFKIVDQNENATFLITSDGRFKLPDGMTPNGEIEIDWDASTKLFQYLNDLGSLFEVELDGSVRVPWGTVPEGMQIVWDSSYILDIRDSIGSCLQIKKDGTVCIARLEVTSHNITTTDPPAWNELSDFWQGYAPIGGATSSYTSVTTGAASIAESDDFAMRQNFLIQSDTKAIRAYFDHTSDHIANYRLGGAGWAGAPANMEISWGVGFAVANSPNAVLGASEFKRGLINGSPRPTVDIHFAGWSDPIYVDVTGPRALTVGTAQNVQGNYRLTAPQGATGDANQGAAQGGFLIDPATRWTNATSPAPSVIASDSDGCAGFRFLSAKRPVDFIICVVSDSIARGIIYATKPDPYLSAGNWPGLLDASLGDRSAVWQQGAGGSRLAAYEVNDRWFERTLNCTHLVITGGSNDLSDGRTSVQLQGHITDRIKVARDMGIKVILATVIPRNAFDSTQNTERNAYNAWVRSNPYDGVLDFDAAIRDPGDQNIMQAAYDGGDGIHPNELGHQAMFSVINQSLFN